MLLEFSFNSLGQYLSNVRAIFILGVAHFSFVRALIFPCVFSMKVAAASYSAEIPSGFYDVAQKENVPVKLLWSLALNESQVKTNLGRVIAWQYTLNHKGAGYYFNTANELKAKINSLILSGETLFDVGIAQVNYHWHKDNFDSVDEMIDPHKNLTYAARYLKLHYKKTRNWWQAVGLYHSPRNGVDAHKYRQRVKAIWETL